MGEILMMKVVTKDGKERVAMMSGSEKAAIYRKLAAVGICETDFFGLQDNRKDSLKEVDLPPDHECYGSGKGVEATIRAASMHCCECAEIVFEDIAKPTKE